MSVVCPTLTGAATEEQYNQQMHKLAKISHRLQIDLADGHFASPRTLPVDKVWWPAAVIADFHVLYRHPAPAVQELLKHKPNLIIIHAEADGDFELMAKACHEHKVKLGVALLPKTEPQVIVPALPMIDHVLIFSGELGSYGGHANLALLDKVKLLKRHKPSLEIGWDGGINSQNISQLVFGGVDVLNVGGYIHTAPDPGIAYDTLARIAEETGTT